MSLGKTTLGSYECFASGDTFALKAVVQNTLTFSFGLPTNIDNIAE